MRIKTIAFVTGVLCASTSVNAQSSSVLGEELYGKGLYKWALTNDPVLADYISLQNLLSNSMISITMDTVNRTERCKLSKEIFKGQVMYYDWFVQIFESRYGAKLPGLTKDFKEVRASMSRMNDGCSDFATLSKEDSYLAYKIREISLKTFGK